METIDLGFLKDKTSVQTLVETLVEGAIVDGVTQYSKIHFTPHEHDPQKMCIRVENEMGTQTGDATVPLCYREVQDHLWQGFEQKKENGWEAQMPTSRGLRVFLRRAVSRTNEIPRPASGSSFINVEKLRLPPALRPLDKGRR